MSLGLNPHLGRCNQLPTANWMCLLSSSSSSSVCRQYFCPDNSVLSHPTNTFVFHLQIFRNLCPFILTVIFSSPWLVSRMNSCGFMFFSEVFCLFVSHLCDKFLRPDHSWPLGSSALHACWTLLNSCLTLELSYLCLCTPALSSEQPSVFIGSLSIFRSWPSAFLHSVSYAALYLLLSDLCFLSQICCFQHLCVDSVRWGSFLGLFYLRSRFWVENGVFPCQCMEKWPREVLLENPMHLKWLNSTFWGKQR